MGAGLCDRRGRLDQGWRLQHSLLPDRPTIAVPRQAQVRPSPGQAGRRVGLPPTSSRLAGLPKTLCERCNGMKASFRTRVSLDIIFVALLAAPLIIRQVSARREAAQAKLDESQALARYGFHLQ